MTEPFLSSSWFRVAALRPELRGDVEVSRHRYRNRAWYVIRDPISGHTHRLTPAAYQIVGRMDGRQTVDEIYRELSRVMHGDAPSQNEVVTLMTQLYGADLFKTDAIPDSGELFERQARRFRSKLLGYLKSPFAFKIPMVNPSRFLEATAGWVTPFFGRSGLLLWLVFVLSGCVVTGMHWSELTRNFSDRALSVGNLPLLACAYLLVKALHELGHAYAVKSFGGDVREMGVMMLVLFPVPYVDASAASALRSKWKRVVVGAAGMGVELLLSAAAAWTWTLAEPGIARAFLFNVMLIGGFSTLVFNGNPLLRFDGYYILSDLLEMPNLGQKANKYWGYLVERYVFGMRSAKTDPATTGERIVYLLFAPASFLYRMLVMVGLALIVSSRFFVVGTILAVWALVGGMLLPLGKLLITLVSGPRLRRKRFRAVTLTGIAVALAAIFMTMVPLPSHTTTEGVVWLPQDSSVKAAADGFVQRVVARPGEIVHAGDLLVEISDPDWDARIRQIEARIEELDAQYVAARFDDRAKARILVLERENEKAALSRENLRKKEGSVRSLRDGVFVFPAAEDAPGRFVREGAVLGYVTPPTSRTLRIVVAQSDIDLVRNRIDRIEVKLRDQPDRSFRATIARAVPAAADELPSKAFGLLAGGQFGTDPRDPKGTKTLQRLFQFDLEFAEEPAGVGFGTRAYVRFDLRPEPLGAQIYRRARQLFLTRFNA